MKIRETKIVEAKLSPSERALMQSLLYEQIERAKRGDNRKSFEEVCILQDLAELNSKQPE